MFGDIVNKLFHEAKPDARTSTVEPAPDPAQKR